MRNENENFQIDDEIPFAHPSVSASTTWKIWKAKRAFVVIGVQYINPTGLAEHADNWYTVQLKNGSTVVASIADTDADAVGADNGIAANTFADGTLSVSAGALNGAADDVLSLVATKGGTQTLPAGHLLVRIRYV